MSEQEIQQRIRLAVSRGPVRLFRNNVGTAWIGKVQRIPAGVLLQAARPFHGGLAKGSSDLIGWRTVTVTPEMVGQKLAVFTSVEVKAPKGRASEEQRAWLAAVQAAGGIGGVARSVEEAEALLGLTPPARH